MWFVGCGRYVVAGVGEAGFLIYGVCDCGLFVSKEVNRYGGQFISYSSHF